jgi:1-acyl-sn-glycerol-3-phosphate acyltransferase
MEQALAAWFLGALAAGAVAYCVRWTRSTPFGFPDGLVYFLCLVLVRIRWRARVDPFPLPRGQGGVIVANHRSSIDPFFIQTVAGRYVSWMVAREYCEHPAFAWFLRRTKAIPVGRGGRDTAATKTAIRYAREGGLVGMFPEGRINQTARFMLPGRPGAVLVALKARVPIVPCYIEGSPFGGAIYSPLLMKAKVRVRFGQPIDLSAYHDCENEHGIGGKILLDVMSRIAHLAGRDDFRPELAGRQWMTPAGAGER